MGGAPPFALRGYETSANLLFLVRPSRRSNLRGASCVRPATSRVPSRGQFRDVWPEYAESDTWLALTPDDETGRDPSEYCVWTSDFRRPEPPRSRSLASAARADRSRGDSCVG